jgi:Carboxypeptidase regulatory-like domain/TonB dependent receptor-like, beta-barrel
MNMQHWGIPRISRLISVSLALIATAHAQTSRGTVTGTVLDSSGAAVARADVALTSRQTGIRLTTGSNEAGVYRFDAVDLGVYDLQVTHPRFRTFLGPGIKVEANRTITIDPKLELGATETAVEVSEEASEILVKDGPLRGGNFQSRDVRDLPLAGLNPLSLARTLPGATEASGSRVWGGGTATGSNNGGGFSVNGQRPRGNNYLLDGTDNNDVTLSGSEQVFTIADAVEEVSVQTGNFGVEFGRAGGGVFNVVTKSGTNHLHGSLLWRYQSQRFDSISNFDRLMGIPLSVFSNSIFGFTAGGPVQKNKTFFFAAYEQKNLHSTANIPVQVPTADAAARLRSLFPNNPRLELYLGALGDLRGTGAPFDIVLGVDPQTGIDRGPAQFATATYVLPAMNDGPQWLARIDHFQSEKHRLSWRYTYDSHIALPSVTGSVPFPGFVQEDSYRDQNSLFADSYTIGPSYTNEFRFSYGRPDVRFATTWPSSVPLAQTLPSLTIANVSAPGVASQNAQFHYGDDFLFQETQTNVSGRHALRYGVELLRQLITQQRGANDLGSLSFTNAVAYSAFSNFLDDYSGPSATASRVFGVKVFHPDQLHQSYFFQDTWKPTPALALTLGLRYENFSQFANALAYPAFSGFGSAQLLVRHDVNTDNRDFGPAFGLAWSPNMRSGLLGRLFGDGKTVWRGGYQINYDSLPTQLIALGPATSTPNAISTAVNALNAGRGTPNWYEQLPATAAAPNVTDSRTVIDPNLRNPYTDRWSFGFQRQLPQSAVLDASYVGSESHELSTVADWNPRLIGGVRLYTPAGPVIAKTSQGNSSYHALQASLNRRFTRGFQLLAAYTLSKLIDSTSEGVGYQNLQQPDRMNRTSVPVMKGGLKLDRGLSDFDRPQRLTIAYLWAIPGPRSGWRRYAFGAWQLAGITTFQSGTPFSVGNGSDRNNDAILADRPDIGNPNAPLSTRAIIFPRCASGYQSPDSGLCVSPGDVHWVEGIGFPNSSTVGRNTLRTAGTNNFDLNLTKSIPFAETGRLELRCEALNAFNHPQYVNVPQMSVNGTPAERFLNRDFTDSGIRTMWVQVKLTF